MHRHQPPPAAAQQAPPPPRDPLREGGAVRPQDLDAVAGGEAALAADDPDREQARAVARERPHRALVHAQAPRHGLTEPKPQLERGRGALARGKARAARLAGENRLEHLLRGAGRDHGRDPRGSGYLGGEHLAAHPALAERRRAAEHRIAGDRPVGDQVRARRSGRPGEHALHLGQEDEQPRPRQHGDLRRKRVVVAERDLVCRGRVVLVHDRDGAELEQRVERAAGVQVGRALGHVGRGQEDLGRGDPLRAERVVPRRLEAGLAERGGRLELRHAARPPGQAEPRQAERDRAGGDDAHRGAGANDRGDLACPVAQNAPAHLRAWPHDQGRSELHDERPPHRCCVPSPTTRYWRSHRSL